MSLSECMSFKEVYLNDIKRETVKKFVQTMPLFEWLDEDKNCGLLFIQIEIAYQT